MYMARPTPYYIHSPLISKVQHWELQFIRAAVANDVLSKKPLFEAAGLPLTISITTMGLMTATDEP